MKTDDVDERKQLCHRKLELGMSLLILVVAAILGRQGAKLVSTVIPATPSEGYHVVIDAGHGGIDSGKVSADGVLEKDVNLVIAQKLQKLLEAEDITVTLTREADCGLYQESDRNKKVTDLQNRCALIEKVKPDCTVSIHQNSYTAPTAKGAQVFYYAQSEGGKELAEELQRSLIERLDKENHRQAKSNSTYYILKRTVSPTVIVECGFLSCPQEAALLTDNDYQNRLAWAIHMGVMNYLNQNCQ